MDVIILFHSNVWKVSIDVNHLQKYKQIFGKVGLYNFQINENCTYYNKQLVTWTRFITKNISGFKGAALFRRKSAYILHYADIEELHMSIGLRPLKVALLVVEMMYFL